MVRVLPDLAVHLHISLFVPSSKVIKKNSPALKLGNTLPSVTVADVAEFERLDASVVLALFLKTIPTVKASYYFS
tara:strand:- start:553 stop:777 length:225 start_codon:yes stop_codon:yes gene_type:complete